MPSLRVIYFDDTGEVLDQRDFKVKKVTVQPGEGAALELMCDIALGEKNLDRDILQDELLKQLEELYGLFGHDKDDPLYAHQHQAIRAVIAEARLRKAQRKIKIDE